MSNPRFSIIVPCYNVQAYLDQCLESLLGQDFTDFEIIAINDCSPDASGQILDDWAKRDERIKVLHLADNVGLGAARNTGLAEATGDYLFFLDSDDMITEGSLGLIAERLLQTDDPDVLIFDYARLYWKGTVKRNNLAAIFQSGLPDTFTVREVPQILNLLMVVWNKVYRRDYINANGFQFPDGFYEDTPWTFPVLLAAQRISSLDHLVVYYRQRRQGSILRTVSRKHFDVFAQYRLVFNYLKYNPQLTDWNRWLFQTMIKHCLTILGNKSRVDKKHRKEFFQQLHTIYVENEPTGLSRPTGADGLKWLLAKHNQYFMFQTLKILIDRLRHARSRLKKSKRSVGRQVFKFVHWVGRRLPVNDNLAIYSAYWHRGYGCNPAAICEKAQELHPSIKAIWATHESGRSTVPKQFKTVQPGTARYWWLTARAKYLINNVNFESELVKRRESIHLQTHHGTPLKRMGLDLMNYPTGANGMNFGRLLTRADRWDYALSSNIHSSIHFERAYPSPYKTLSSGYPRNDRLINASAEDIKNARNALNIPEGTTVILYAPTHRDYNYTYVPRIDFNALLRDLGDDYVLLLRTHYYYSNSTAIDSDIRQIIDVTGHGSVEELQLASDILLTDYSSIMFDYANLNRPIVIYADDWKAYKELRGVYFDIMEINPGPVTQNQDELVKALQTDLIRDPDIQDRLHKFQRKFCEFDDGRASERVVRTIMG